MLSDTLIAVEAELLTFLSNSKVYEPSKVGFEELLYLSPDMAQYFLAGALSVKGWYKSKVHEFKPKTFFVSQVLADDFHPPEISNEMSIEKSDVSLYQYIVWQSLKPSFSAALIKKAGKSDLLVAFDKSKQNDNVLYYYDNDQIVKPLNIKKMRESGYQVVFDNDSIAQSLKGMLKFRRQQLSKVAVVVAREICRPVSRKKINIANIG
tara:strand:+ start:10993 stop:11616 length:624 start_codon:yes stop_codon:yes gene_type:complete